MLTTRQQVLQAAFEKMEARQRMHMTEYQQRLNRVAASSENHSRMLLDILVLIGYCGLERILVSSPSK